MEFICNGETIQWAPERLVIAGYTGKDQDAVKKHIDELKELGVPAPPQVPMLYDLSPELLQTAEEITVVGNDGSGEAEVVLLDVGGRWYVGLGSDHTDRVLEAISIQKSKQVCAKPMTREVWTLESILHRWDDIEMNSWVLVDGEEKLYQSGKLGEFMHPNDLMRLVKDRGYAGSNMALYCGTLPLHGGFVFGGTFRAELVDRQEGRKLELQYSTHILKNAEEE
ncbi:DUF2848 family protein [Paenibacillus sp. OAS669]|uniref:DUF2848 family protein n=1 Tax=Paenibacillus sp. OAS669 TaxID=2663821 RepID=UPI00178A2F01|nr:DUF2848 family protein [Paenibacillus sp. OAS669]MBE1444120.1 hypothetical protein [Paenibacillus sp. OAS669]